MTKSYKLVLQSGPDAGTEFILEKPELYLGRDVNNDIMINDPEVSRRHARFIRQGENYIYEDLGSTNGSFVLSQRITTPVLLTPGTTITIGERVVVYFAVNVVDPSATMAAPRIKPAPAAPVIPPAQTPLPPAPPPMQAYPPPPPVYNSPSSAYPPPPMPGTIPPPQRASMPAAERKNSNGVVVLLIILGVILVFCVIPWIIIEITNSYCSLFPGIFNAIQAGVCP